MDADRVLRYWTLQSPDGSVATCELVRTAAGLEVRCDRSPDGSPISAPHAESIGGITDALDLAETWKASFVAQGWVPPGGPGSPPRTRR
jgi:hypothetical protein